MEKGSLDHQENNNMKHITEQLLENSKVYVRELGLEMVPYSIALSALLLEKTDGVMNSLENKLSQFKNIESELKNLSNE